MDGSILRLLLAKGTGRAIRRLCMAAPQRGMALLAVMILLFLTTGSSAMFVSFMHRHQVRAGIAYRSEAALSFAEAGMHWALAALETGAAIKSLRDSVRGPEFYSEARRVGAIDGRFVVTIRDELDGGVLITSVGQVAGEARRLQVRAYLASPALLAALYGSSAVRLEKPPAAALILPYGVDSGGRRWFHIAAGRELWFATTSVSINDPLAAFDTGAGPVGASGHIRAFGLPGPVRLALFQGALLTVGDKHEPVDLQQLRALGVYVDGIVVEREALPAPPTVDLEFYRARATSNTANAQINAAAGRYLGDADLARKSDSLYTQLEFERLLTYLAGGTHSPRLEGTVYVMGYVNLPGGHRLELGDGTLLVEGTLHMHQGSILRVAHSSTTRTFPGVLVLGSRGRLIVAEGAQLFAHGLVFANRSIDVIDGGRIDVVGSILGNDPQLSFRNRAGTVMIRYDPAVLGTPGLRVPAGTPVVAWIAEWKELGEREDSSR